MISFSVAERGVAVIAIAAHKQVVNSLFISAPAGLFGSFEFDLDIGAGFLANFFVWFSLEK